MDSQVAWTVVCGLLIVVGAVGTIIPVLPGSILVGLALLVWAFVVQGTVGWTVFAVGALLVAAGMSASTVLTGRAMKKRQIPGRSVVAGVVLGIAGFFVLPVVGLIVGFALGLFLSEWERHRSIQPAVSSSLAALKATGLGMLVEFGFAALAGSVWIAGVWIHFATR
jgi:uncharacterized protein YqgC (DUF456 family)